MEMSKNKFRKMAKTHLHVPFAKMSNEINSGLRGFQEQWRDLRPDPWCHHKAQFSDLKGTSCAFATQRSPISRSRYQTIKKRKPAQLPRGFHPPHSLPFTLQVKELTHITFGKFTVELSKERTLLL